MTSTKKIIAVVGATGAQGGGLVRAILADPDGPFAVRALTTNADSAKARELAAQGAEVVRADLDDEKSLREAFDGAYGAYVVTNYWVQRSPEEEKARTRPEMELAQAAAAARAAKDAGLQHVVWSTLEDTRPHFERLGIDVPSVMGTYKVPHFDAKAEANAFFTELGVPTTFLQSAFYFEAFTGGQGPHRNERGELVLTMPMADNKLALIAAEDIGKTALGIFRRGGEFVGKTVSIAGEHLTGQELAAKMTSVLGEKVVYRPVTHDEMRASGQPAALEIANNFQFYSDASEYFTGVRDLALVRQLNPDLRSLDSWLKEHKHDIPRD
ncbi:NmrA/HSCARG family protein [Streptomyces prasinus]|uniref:NmrA/HSCARG family protein n=1 Tax=Streptomyces prasinus TaxID=67345 RepID=A0ABX6AT36_9ACTN|nr:NmrA/HSCARG family protein [Streptomyces prasinus]QEV04917.1 NmrA/HSCARG family protein [Streptomyces prasinus]